MSPEGAQDLKPILLGPLGGAARLEALAIGVPRAQEVCARAVNRGVQLLALLYPREREQVVFEDAEGRACDVSRQRIGARLRQTRRGAQSPHRAATEHAL